MVRWVFQSMQVRQKRKSKNKEGFSLSCPASSFQSLDSTLMVSHWPVSSKVAAGNSSLIFSFKASLVIINFHLIDLLATLYALLFLLFIYYLSLTQNQPAFICSLVSPLFIFSCKLINACKSASGLGGQPATYTSTGIT